MEYDYVTIANSTIDQFDYIYHSTKSLAGLLRLLTSLPSQELTKYIKYISSINDVISSCDEDKRISDSIANSIINILKKSLRPVEEEKFMLIVTETIDNFYTKFTTVGDLRSILEKISYISPENLNVNKNLLQEIRATIWSFGTVYEKKLTTRQLNRLYFVLNGSKKPTHMPMSIDTVDENYTLHFTDDTPLFSALSMSAEKFGEDDPLAIATYSLLVDLSYNNMESSLTPIIYDYFEVIDQLKNEHKYSSVIEEIKKCFHVQNWQFKTEQTLGGFYSKPDRTQLVNDLQVICERYLM
jgi:hypothetical protein